MVATTIWSPYLHDNGSQNHRRGASELGAFLRHLFPRSKLTTLFRFFSGQSSIERGVARADVSWIPHPDAACAVEPPATHRYSLRQRPACICVLRCSRPTRIAKKRDQASQGQTRCRIRMRLDFAPPAPSACSLLLRYLHRQLRAPHSGRGRVSPVPIAASTRSKRDEMN